MVEIKVSLNPPYSKLIFLNFPIAYQLGEMIDIRKNEEGV